MYGYHPEFLQDGKGLHQVVGNLMLDVWDKRQNASTEVLRSSQTVPPQFVETMRIQRVCNGASPAAYPDNTEGPLFGCFPFHFTPTNVSSGDSTQHKELAPELQTQSETESQLWADFPLDTTLFDIPPTEGYMPNRQLQDLHG